MTHNDAVVVESSVHTSSKNAQPTVSESFLLSNTDHYTKSFCSILFLLEEELAFIKLKPMVELQIANGLSIMSTNKINDKACAKLAEIISEIVRDKGSNFINQSRFSKISGDASEARKTSKEKELVFLKILADGFKGVLPVTFQLNCQRLKDFGGGTSKRTLNAIIDAYHTYSPNDSLTKPLTCAAADGASVDSGCHTGVFTKLSELVGWELPTLHCMNHKLELAMRDSYTGDHTFVEIKEMLDALFRLFKNSGRLWHIYQWVAEALDLVPVCFPCVGGTRFQSHALSALSSFLRNFLLTMPFAEHVDKEVAKIPS